MAKRREEEKYFAVCDGYVNEFGTKQELISFLEEEGDDCVDVFKGTRMSITKKYDVL